MLLELDKLVEFWGDKQMTPMLLIDEEDNIEWCNRWAVWLFQVNLKKKEPAAAAGRRETCRIRCQGQGI